MMKFNIIDENTVTATNSLKPVTIVRSIDCNNFDRNTWMVYTTEGRLDDDFTSAGPFVSFDAARKNAEMNVGFTWKELAEALKG